MSLLSDLQSLDAALRTAEAQASGDGDLASAAALLNVISNLENAILLVGAQDITAALPNDQDGAQIKGAINDIGKAAGDIAKRIKTINQAVDIGTNVVTLIGQMAGGQVGAAVATAAHLVTIA